MPHELEKVIFLLEVGQIPDCSSLCVKVSLSMILKIKMLFNASIRVSMCVNVR